MPDPSAGTLTFLFTDIEGSTRLWEQDREAMAVALDRHDALLTHGIEQHGGTVVKSRGEGDSFFAVFSRAPDAVAAACALQQALLAEPWPTPTPLRVRMALHADTAERRGGDYYGPGVNRCARLRAAAHGGQALLSQAVCDQMRDELPPGASLRDLGAHRLKDLQQPEQLFQLLHPDLPADFPPLRSLEAFAHNLPRQLTRFIGREQEMAEVKELLSRTCLLTLTGSGGCGKTRLALQVAADQVDAFAAGVWLVELAALADPALVPQAAAAALGVREEPGRPLMQTLADYLRPRLLLLVLDNCEHLLSACAALVESLLRTCPHLRVLATSREGLGIAGEQTYRVPSLSMPPEEGVGRRVSGVGPDRDTRHPTPDTLLQFEAVQLFLDRAALSQPSFVLTPANASAVVQICHRLDGIPLAIELAAARVKALPVEQIAARLDDMFRLLTGGSRTALPRQQTLRALIDWSYGLLSASERVLLRRLSVFAGGWTLESAEAICADDPFSAGGEQLERGEMIDLLAALVDKSLVVYEERGGEGRYRLLETIRQYGRERLLEAGEAETLRQSHHHFYREWTEQAGQELKGARHQEWWQRLEQEHDNVRAALAWARDSGDTAAGLQLVAAMGWFWWARHYWAEGREHLAELLTLAPPDNPDRGLEAARATAMAVTSLLAIYRGDGTARNLAEESVSLARQMNDRRALCWAVYHLSEAAYIVGDWSTAHPSANESLALAREVHDPFYQAFSLWMLGRIAREQNDHDTARFYFDQSVTEWRKQGEPWGLGLALLSLGNEVAHFGEFALARQFLRESLDVLGVIGHRTGLFFALRFLGEVLLNEGEWAEAGSVYQRMLSLGREISDHSQTGEALVGLALVARQQGNYESARALYEEAIRLARAANSRGLIGITLCGLAVICLRQGQPEAALTHAREALAVYRDPTDKYGIVRCLEGLAQIAMAQGNPDRVARLFGAAEGLREALKWPVCPFHRTNYDCAAVALVALGREAYASAQMEGKTMSLENAIAYALDEASAQNQE